MKSVNKISLKVLCALALCVISGYLGYFFCSRQSCIGQYQSGIRDRCEESYTVYNRFSGKITPEYFIGNRCVSDKTGSTNDTVLLSLWISTTTLFADHSKTSASLNCGSMTILPVVSM